MEMFNQDERSSWGGKGSLQILCEAKTSSQPSPATRYDEDGHDHHDHHDDDHDHHRGHDGQDDHDNIHFKRLVIVMVGQAFIFVEDISTFVWEKQMYLIKLSRQSGRLSDKAEKADWSNFISALGRISIYGRTFSTAGGRWIIQTHFSQISSFQYIL